MAKPTPAKIPDWAIGLILTVGAVLFFLHLDFLDVVEAKLFDIHMKLLGTPSYMSPEQIAGQKVDGRSDLFSRGIVLVERLAGEHPFKGDSIATIMSRITSGEPPALASLAPAVPGELHALVATALRKPVGERFQTGAEFSAALRACTALRAPAPAG